jgi:hypothetical protein
MLWLIVLVVLLILLVAAVPAWPYSGGWGYSPAGVLAALLVVLLLLWAFGVIHVGVTVGGTGGGASPVPRVASPTH